MIDEYIQQLSAMSDEYGYPYLMGIMDIYGVLSLSELTERQFIEYLSVCKHIIPIYKKENKENDHG